MALLDFCHWAFKTLQFALQPFPSSSLNARNCFLIDTQMKTFLIFLICFSPKEHN